MDIDAGDDEHQLILIAAYGDLQTAAADFSDLQGRLKHGLELRSTALVTKDADGAAHVLEAANKHGRAGTMLGAGMGLLFGLVFQPLLLGVIVGGAGGALVSAIAEHELRIGLRREVGHALTEGTGVILALVYPNGRAQAETSMTRANSIAAIRMDRSTIQSIDEAVAAEIAKLPATSGNSGTST
jgi:hypothetical protein